MSVEKIDQLVEDGLIDEVVQRVKTGKEAEVFVVRKGDQYLAAKVYKDRLERNFRNNAGYREGRAVRNSRDARAMAKGSKYGVEKAEDDWMHTEHDALNVLLHAGVRVPKPELFYEGVLLMELVLGPDGQPAPRLIECALTEEEAVAIHKQLVDMVVRMTLCDRIHGDLSPFNILLAWDGPTIIDLPQVVAAAHNPQADKFLIRDVKNVTEHLAKFAPQLKARANDGVRIFNAYEKRELAVGFLPEEHPELDKIRVGVEAGNRGFRGKPFRPKPEEKPGARPHGARPGGASAGHANRGDGARPPAGNRPVEQRAAPSPRPASEHRPAQSPRPAAEQRPAQSTRPASEHRPAPSPRPAAEQRPTPSTRPAPESRPPQTNRPPPANRPAHATRPPPGPRPTPPASPQAPGQVASGASARPPGNGRPNHARPNRPPPRGPEVVRMSSPLTPGATPSVPGANPRPDGARPGGAEANRHRFRNQRRS